MKLKYSLAMLMTVLLWGCKNSDSWMGRQWHNTTARYNVLFNARTKLNDAVLSLREGHKDDYRTVIDLYNYGTETNLKATQGVMDEVVKKASTLLDKHPKSKWVDEAHHTMAAAYFYKSEFGAAIEIYEFIIGRYKDPYNEALARLGIAKCLLFQKKYGEAEALLNTLKADKSFPQKLKPQLNHLMGAVLIKMEKWKSAAEALELALPHQKGKMDKYRTRFALAQVYEKLNETTKAGKLYKKVIKMNPPYDMAFNAKINLVGLLGLEKNGTDQARGILKGMLKDDKNIEYFDQIYFMMGKNEMQAGNEKKGLEFFRLSLRNSKGNRTQQTNTYLTIGDYYYNKKSFETAALYYDSAAKTLDNNHPQFESIAVKGEMLGEILKHILTIKKQDSLLALARDPILREKTIDLLIKREEELKKNPTPTPTPNPGAITPGFGGPSASGGSTSGFPFYNQATKARGYNEFQAYWGNRQNRDNWRLNSKKSIAGGNSGSTGTGNDNDTSTSGLPPNVSADRKKYYKEIPMTREAQQEADKKIEDALFALAGVYENKLNAWKDAIDRYEELLRRYPFTAYEEQTLYELAKLYKKQGDENGHVMYKRKLEEKFPQSKYIALLDEKVQQNMAKDTLLLVGDKELETLYTRCYDAYKSGKYTEALDLKKEADRKFSGSVFQSRFEYLAALCIIKLGKPEEGVKELQRISEDYAGSEIASQAVKTIAAYERQKAGPSKDSANASAASQGWVKYDGKEDVYVMLLYPKGGNTNMIRAGLSDYATEQFKFETLTVSSPRPVGEYTYLLITGFTKPEVSKSFQSMLAAKPEFFAARNLFEYELVWISKTNSQKLAQNNRVHNYIEFFKANP